MIFRALTIVALATLYGFLSSSVPADETETTSDPTISFAKDIRPLLAEKCFGCHQPAQHRSEYVMTDFETMLTGGETGLAAIVPGDSAQSQLVDLITSVDGKAAMPPDAEPFSEEHLNLIRKWIDQGAKNDFIRETFSFNQDSPPRYTHAPNISSLDFSPDGKVLAVTGFNEILVLQFYEPVTEVTETVSTQPSPFLAKQVHLVKRLIGLSSRIESLQFSPDGKKIAASGGNPGELGEIQVWDLASGELLLSKIVAHDTVYGICWSPDGSKLSFGSTDTTLRVIDATTGQQILFQGAHEDWVRDTVFSVDGSQLVSVGRDMSCKLIDVATQRFIDNITSITPGVLKGGIATVARHPSRDEILIGGADGIPKIYRMNRLTDRVIGDDANMIRRMSEMPGRLQSVAISDDGKRFAAGSSLDGAGTLRVFPYEFDSSLPDNIKAIVAKQNSEHSPEEQKLLEAYLTDGVSQIFSISIAESGVYAVDFHPNGKWIVAGGGDGQIRVFETESGKLLDTIQPVALEPATAEQATIASWHFEVPATNDDESKSSNSANMSATKLHLTPETIHFQQPIDYAQIVVQAELADSSLVDVTDDVELKYDEKIVFAIGSLVQVSGPGTTEIQVSWNGLTATIPTTVELPESSFHSDFRRDVNPVLSKLGCNAGTCHGSQGGKNGFKLSLRGYDPIFDVRAFTDDMAARRTNLAAADFSLMLLKPSAQVAHEGGKLFEKDSRYYQLVKNWIESGANLNLESAKVVSIELFPKNPSLPAAGSQQHLRVVASYSDGSSRDVTREAVISAGDLEIIATDGPIVKALRRGESPILARYEGAFTATTLTVMGNRDGFVWTAPETWGTIDELVAAKWERMKIEPAGLCTDAEFIRRVYLDLTGLPPAAEQIDAFVNDARPVREKRDELVDQLVGNDSFVEHWANKWADLLQVNSKYLGSEGAAAFRNWIRDQVKANRPYNEFAYEVLTASGSNRENPPAAYYKIHRAPEEVMENTTHLFLATRFNCNKCHDHPFERWTQDQYYETAAFFSQIERSKDPESKDQTIGGSAVDGATPLYEIIADVAVGEMKHDRTGLVAEPKFPFACQHPESETDSRRAKLASWITSPDNPYFATSYVNRLWGYMTGTGLIEPLDDIRAGNPPSNPELLAYLRDEFVKNNFDARNILKLICKSRTYQLSIETNQFNADDRLNFSHAQARRLPAEVLFDSIHFVTGSELRIPGVEPGTRAAALPDSGAALPSGFLSTLGRPARESACECERVNDLQLGSVLALVSGPDLSQAINDPENRLTKLVGEVSDDRKLIDQIYLNILNRHANDSEIELSLHSLTTIGTSHQQLHEQRDKLKSAFESQLPELEKQRLIAIESTNKALESAIKELDPNLLNRETEHATNETAAAQELENYKTTAGGLDAWSQSQLVDVQWHPLIITNFKSEIGHPYATRPDRSVVIQPTKGKDTYSVETATDLTGISAVRLELLADEALPVNGPGLAPNGNLVLSEFEIEIANPDTPENWLRLEIGSAIANIEQPDFPITATFDGNLEQSGWAIGNAIGKTSWATFQLKLPAGFSGGTLMRFRLRQNFDDDHKIGRFRISVSKHHKPIGLGLSESLLAALANPAADRSEEIKTQIASAFERGDPQLLALQNKLNTAKTPLVIAPEIIRLREKLARVSQPVPTDPLLLQLELDVVASQKQLANLRLTAAQDLAWALINSPSFLFNR